MKKNLRYLIMTGLLFAAWPFVLCRPLRLFSSLVHDVGHSLGAFFAGFGAAAFEGGFNHGGAGITASGNNWFRVLVAITAAYIINLGLGYVFMSVAAGNSNIKKYFVGSLTILLLVLSFNYASDYMTMLFTVIYVCVVILMFMIDKDHIFKVLLELLGLTMFMFVVYDTLVNTILYQINSALHISGSWVKQLATDSDILAAATKIPAVIWAIFWLTACALLYWRAIRHRSFTGGKRRQNG